MRSNKLKWGRGKRNAPNRKKEHVERFQRKKKDPVREEPRKNRGKKAIKNSSSRGKKDTFEIKPECPARKSLLAAGQENPSDIRVYIRGTDTREAVGKKSYNSPSFKSWYEERRREGRKGVCATFFQEVREMTRHPRPAARGKKQCVAGGIADEKKSRRPSSTPRKKHLRRWQKRRGGRLRKGLSMTDSQRPPQNDGRGKKTLETIRWGGRKKTTKYSSTNHVSALSLEEGKKREWFPAIRGTITVKRGGKKFAEQGGREQQNVQLKARLL